ncbi:MAG: hypothetical protein KDK11_14740 [Maritimibacter sp.]|nr:hypothetical protein [Maritimibacter sp.]
MTIDTTDNRTRAEQIRDLIQLAGIYWEDGAPSTAADRLRKAARLLEQEALERAAIFGTSAEVRAL